MISAQISPEHPEHGGLLRTIFDYYVEIPLDRLLKARKEIWQQPHEEAFRELEARLSGAQLDAERRHPYLSKLYFLLFVPKQPCRRVSAESRSRSLKTFSVTAGFARSFALSKTALEEKRLVNEELRALQRDRDAVAAALRAAEAQQDAARLEFAQVSDLLPPRATSCASYSGSESAP